MIGPDADWVDEQRRVAKQRVANKPGLIGDAMKDYESLRVGVNGRKPAIESPEKPARIEFEAPEPPNVRAPRIPKRFENARFATFDVSEPAQEAARRAVEEWAGQVWAGKPAMLALIGPPGVGKSHLLYAAARALYKRGLVVYANPWYKLADELRYGRAGGFEPRDVQAELWKENIVMIDEIRPTANTAFDDTALAKFACHAYDNNVSVMITTNVNPLDLVMGPAAADRFNRVIVNGESRR